MMVGAVVSITIFLLADKFETGVKFETALVATSVIVPEIPLVFSCDALSVDCTV